MKPETNELVLELSTEFGVTPSRVRQILNRHPDKAPRRYFRGGRGLRPCVGTQDAERIHTEAKRLGITHAALLRIALDIAFPVIESMTSAS